MTNQSAIRWARNPWLAAFLFAAFFAHALVPTGFMPGPGGLVICWGHDPGPETLDRHHMAGMQMAGMDMAGMDMAGMDMGHHGGHATHDGTAPNNQGTGVCPFAAAATTMAMPAILHGGILIHFVSTAMKIPPEPFIACGTIVPTHLPRGPPLNA